ncbi:hypothetical protein [Flavobacterium pectinovorum]|uniref:Uncharacterized protein n=1 Tax=Flavobacterium pectinovorum TaxID=29533 RepID=A0A502F3Z0_9FLAO|nr:hypothetical protein [Flavobacterium pectinovorum]TPG44112.1 hypothetical protein EAH81_06080 [Flavobacterium pectinovorum]
MTERKQLEILTNKSVYQNPIFGCDYPDLSLLREGKDYSSSGKLESKSLNTWLSNIAEVQN